MISRGQADTIGTVLLLGVVTVTITGAGGVVLADLQADVGSTPVADLDSEVTPVTVTLEHRGGASLVPNETTIELIGADEEISLENRIDPGGSESWEFDRLDGPVELRVVDDDSGGIVYRQTHSIRNSIVDLVFGVDGWTDPVYLLEGHPAIYTVNQEFEEGVPTDVAEQTNITLEDDSQLTVDENETTLKGTEVGFETTATAEVDNRTVETSVTVLESDPSLAVDTKSQNPISGNASMFNGELVELSDSLPDVDLFFRYWQMGDRSFNNAPDDNGDDLIADGEFHTLPDGYAHDGDYVHDNMAFEPGENRTYTFEESGSGADLYGSLRAEPQTEATGSVDHIAELNAREAISEDIDDDETVELEVEYTDDSSAFRFYIDDDHVATWTSLESHDKLYFSSYEWAGSSGSRSLRLTTVSERGEITREPGESGVETTTDYSTTVTGLTAEEDYQFVAYTEQQIGGKTLRDEGDPIDFRIDAQTITTENVTVTDATSATFKGNLTSLGDLQATDLGVEYWQLVDRTFNEESEDNGDDLIADGDFQTLPNGYAHDGDYVHDNMAFEPGENRTYTFDESGSGADLYGSLRAEPQTEATGSVDHLAELSAREAISEDIDDDETFELEVTYAANGSAFLFLVDGDHAATWTLLREYDELYFSSYEWAGSSGSRSLRLTDVRERGEIIPETPKYSDKEPTAYNIPIDGLDLGESYEARAYAERESGGQQLTDTGEPIAFTTENQTVRTGNATGLGFDAIEIESELLDLGTVQQTDLGVEYWELVNRPFTDDPENNGDNLIADGDFQTLPEGYGHDGDYVHDNVAFEPGENRTYTFDESGSGADLYGSLRTDEQTDATGSVDHIPDLSARHEISENIPEDEAFELEVKYAANGSAFVFYTDGDHAATWALIEEYDELYFSSYEWAGSSGSHSLRLIDVLEDGEIETEPPTETGVEGPTPYTYNTTIDGLDPDVTYQFVAYAQQESNNGKIARDTGHPLTYTADSQTIQTLDATAVGLGSAEAEGELLDLGSLQETSLSFNYWQLVDREFNEDPVDNGDDLIADGDFQTLPEGYAHDGDYVHDNVAFEPGENRTYTFEESGSGADLYGSLRADEQTDSTGDVDHIPDLAAREEISEDIDDDQEFKLNVQYAENGSAFLFYIDRNHTATWTLEAAYDELYFSSYEWAGSSGSRSLRLTGVRERGQLVAEPVEDGFEGPTPHTYNTTIDGLDQGESYQLVAYTKQESNNQIANDTGETVAFSTNNQTVQTIDASDTGSNSIQAEGELSGMGGLEGTDLLFKYWELLNRTFNEEPKDNGDNLIADGDYHTTPDGYAHDGDYVHDNVAFEPGENRTYTFEESGSGADLYGSLRADEQTDATGSVDHIPDLSAREAISEEINADETVELEVEYAANGSAFQFYIDGDHTATWRLIGEYDELYFSSYEWAGSSGSRSLRLTDLFERDELGRELVAEDVTEPTEYSTEITSVTPRTTYDVAAFAEREDGELIATDRGGWVEVTVS